MRLGFIGTGSMGSILIESFLTSKALLPNQMIASNRSPDKLMRLLEKYPGLKMAKTNSQTVQESDMIFLCVKPLEYKRVLDEIQSFLKDDQLLVSITSPVLISDLEKVVSCKVAKMIPSITNYVQAGASLLMFGTRCSAEDKDTLFHLVEKISHPILIDESITRVSSDIVSCGPAFFSYLLQQFISAAVNETQISENEAVFLTTEMIIGVAELISKGPFSLQTLQQRVCVPGGITWEGLKALQNAEQEFSELYRNTNEKFREDLQEVRHMFHGKSQPPF
jgi:competence protein ComER